MRAGVYVFTKESAIVLFSAGNVDLCYSRNGELIKRTGSVFCFDSVLDCKYVDALQMVILQYFDTYRIKFGVIQYTGTV